MATKEQREMCEALYEIVNSARKTFKELEEAFGRWVKFDRQEEIDRNDSEI